MGHDHRAHVIRAPTWACVCARVGEGGPQGVTWGLSRGLEGAGSALWDVGRLRRGNETPRQGLRRAQKIRVCLGLKIHHPPQGAASANRKVLRP